MFKEPLHCIVLIAFLMLTLPSIAVAQKKYDPGASDAEIKIGNIMPYSGPASAYALIGKTIQAYFNKINDEGGVNGRKLKFISYDDALSPPKTVEQTRKLVESDEVLLIFAPLGTPTQAAVQKYMNIKKVPQLFVAAGATRFGNPKEYPWSMGWQPNYRSEGLIYGKYILANYEKARIGILYQNDDYGKDLLKGLKDGLGDKAASMISLELTYDPTEPTVDSQIVRLKASGVDVFVNISTPKFAAQSIKKIYELGWSPVHILDNVSNSVASVIKPAGFEKAQGIVSTSYLKDPSDPTWTNDPAIRTWRAFMEKYLPDGDQTSTFAVTAYAVSETLVQVLRQCGDDLTRENVMRQAANLKHLQSGMLLPGIEINTDLADYFPIEQLQMMRFEGESWKLFGPMISGEPIVR
jgi:branched-chain amino acid transport system substrate-binding protein